MSVTRHRTTGAATTGANMYGRYHADKESGTGVGILFAPGGGGDETSWQVTSITQPNSINTALRYLTRDSYAFRFFTFHTDWDWGNSTVVTRINDAYGDAQTNCHFNASRVHLFGASMGCCCVLNWAKAHPSNVASLSLVLPAVDIQDIEDNHRVLGYSLPEPHSAYGGSRPPDASNPADNTASFSSMPVKMWYSNDDTICTKTTVEAFGTAVGAEMVNLGNRIPSQTGFAIAGHDAGNLDPAEVTNWIVFNDVIDQVEVGGYVHSAGRGQ